MPSSNRKTKTSRSSSRSSRSTQPSLARRIPLNRTIVLALFVLASTVGLYYGAGLGHASSAELRSGIGASGGPYCLDDKGDGGNGAEVDAWACNGSAAQHFSFSGGFLRVGTGCATESGASATTGAQVTRPVVIGPCASPAPWGSLWTEISIGGGAYAFKNNHASSSGGTSYCLNVSGAAADGQILSYPCGNTWQSNEKWYFDTWTGSGSGGGGNTGIVAIAEQFAGREHETPDDCNCGGAIIDGANIDTFTQNHPGELWCADFASWVYWKSGNGLASRGSFVRTPGVDGIKAWFEAHGHWYANTSYNRSYHPPKPGDFLAFYVPSANDTHGGVVKGTVGDTLTDIEGNYSNGVYNVAYSMSGGLNDHGNDATGWGEF
jgi:hypothetical protein